MKICICDDDKNQCEELKEMILKHDTHEIIIYHSAEEMLFECENHFSFDCLFLDIQMKKINGIELAKKIRLYDEHLIIVFLSAISDYVFEGYEVQAIRYLLKPLSEKKCFELLDLIQNSLKQEVFYLYINKTKINCDDILYIEAIGHYCHLHMNNTLETKENISKLLKELPSYFIQTHRSYLVNLKHVDAINKDVCVLDNQDLIPISRNSIKSVNKAFMEFLKGGIMND